METTTQEYKGIFNSIDNVYEYKQLTLEEFDNDDIDSQYKPEDFAEYKKWLYGKKDIEEMTFTAKEYDAWLEGNRKAAKKQCSDNDIDLKIRTISFDVKMSDSDFTDLINTLEVQMKQQHESATD